MSKSRVLGLVASASLLLTLFVVLPGMGADEREKEKRDALYRPLGLFTEVLGLVRSNYVEPVELRPLLAGAFSGMTEALDPFSEYIPPEKTAAFAAFEAARSRKDFIDTGIVLARRFGFPVVVAATDGSPAAAAGIKSDDVIEKVDGQLTRNMALWELDAKLAGKAGGRVRLEVVREGKPRHRTIDLVRASWSATAPSAQRVEGETVIRIAAFVPGTAAGVKKILEPLDRTHPVVLDVRNNALGTFEEAARTAALFVAPGRLGELKGRKIEGRTFRAEPGERVHESRLVVLVDSGTAGAAELFAAALRDATVRTPEKEAKASGKPGKEDDEASDLDPTLETAKGAEKLPVRLVGETTVGMGFTAQVVKLASGGSLKLSVGKVHTLAGKTLCPRGLQPDDRVFHGPSDEATGKADPVLRRGLQVLGETARLKAAA